MTQGTEAVREIPRALSQIYYCIDGHEMRESEKSSKSERG